MDTRTSQRTGGPFAGTTLYQDRGPSADDMPWCTSYADVGHVFRSKDWEQGGGGARDSYEFTGDGLLAPSGPCRARNKGVKPTGIAFGGGVHTCIAIGMTIGDPSREDSAGPAGLMVACLRELHQRECGRIP